VAARWGGARKNGRWRGAALRQGGVGQHRTGSGGAGRVVHTSRAGEQSGERGPVRGREKRERGILVSVRLSGLIPIIDFWYRLLKWADTKNLLDYWYR
jgi:hypothetical protein